MDESSEVQSLDFDWDRPRRRGFTEAVYCEGKSPDQLREVARQIRDASTDSSLAFLFTRADAPRAAALKEILPDAFHDEQAQFLSWPALPPPVTGTRVVVACAGTSDWKVAREAELTASYMGRETQLIADVGVAGLHRLLSHQETLREAGAIVVVAGMDGALPSVVAGLVEVPVIAVPTSVGYGAAFEGLAALLTMMNSCAAGVAVVNIDNGYGAGVLAAQITSG
ncbi:MAG: nickel pincer cofactor biosynthesis protein LarB [Actinomycetaceae bacterium]|nr:nickel pincer cofactor biosynthesis protein LarB [Actinomycetaceae bacterium]